MIAFDYEGKSYVVDFERTKRVVGFKPYAIQPPGTTDRIMCPMYSTYPDTTVVVREMVPEKTSKEWPVIWQAKARYCPKDKFSLEAGRVHALRKLTDTVLKDQKGVAKGLWEAYNGRYRKAVKPSVTDQLRDVVELLERLKNNQQLPPELAVSVGLSHRSLKNKLDEMGAAV